MTVWQVREWIESNLPGWVLFIPLVSLLIILILILVEKIRDHLNKDLK